MKTVIISLSVLTIGLISCYKNKCHTCTTKLYRNGILQNSTDTKYCDKTRKEIKSYEGTTTSTKYDSVQGMDVTGTSVTTCN